MMSEEETLLKDIFQVAVREAEGVIALPGLASELKDGSSFVKNDTLFDAMLFERLQLPQTNLLAYLADCYDRADYQRGKPWNEGPQARAFLALALQRIVSYAVIVLSEKDMFAQQQLFDPAAASISSPAQFMSCVLLDQMIHSSLNQQMFLELIPRLQEAQPSFRQTLLTQVLFRLSKSNVVQGRCCKLNNILAGLLAKQ